MAELTGNPMQTEKKQVSEFWNRASCGEELYLPDASPAGLEAQATARYRLEPFIAGFARFEEARQQRVLEIGVGLGADHQRFAEAGAHLYGVDLTPRAVAHTRRRLDTFGLRAKVAVADAENLGFAEGSFDLVYSWGVLHHTPNTAQAIAEVHRVLKPGGVARIMIYHKWSMVGAMLWLRYALLALRPWRTLDYVYARYLESPGTKAYSVGAARKLFDRFSAVRIATVLTHGDLLESAAGQRHRGPVLSVARWIWPRAVIRRALPRAGLCMLIEATK